LKRAITAANVPTSSTTSQGTLSRPELRLLRVSAQRSEHVVGVWMYVEMLCAYVVFNYAVLPAAYAHSPSQA